MAANPANEFHAFRKSILLAMAAAIALPTSAFAQSTVTGRVVDENGAALPGAEVAVRETGQRVITDRQGRFVFPSLQDGQATLDVTYQGLSGSSRSVNVRQGMENDVQINLQADRSDGSIVVFGNILDATARALNQQKTADGTTNVVSADAIGRFPDPNIAEALQRVPGFGVERDQGEGNFISIRGAPSEFTAVTVDGIALRSTSPDTRAIDLGTFNSDLVASIEVSKTLIPSQEADSIAGSINLVTRSAFDIPRLRYSANGGASLNDLGNTNDYRFGGAVSNVFGPFGIVLSGSLAQTDRRVDNVESVWDIVELPDGTEILGVPEQEFKDYDTRRERITLAGGLELRPDNVSNYFIRANFNRRTDDEFRNLLAIVYEDGTLQAGSTEQLATWNRTRVAKEFRHRIVRDQSLVVSAGGEHNWSDLSLDYNISYTESEQTYPIRAQLLFRSSLRPNIVQDFSNPNTPDISLFTTGEHLRTADYAFRQNTFREQDTFQDEWAFGTNLKIPTEMFGVPSTIQLGARARLADISTDNEQWRDRRSSSAPGQSLTALLSDERSQNFDYLLGNKIKSDLGRAYFAQISPVSQAEGVRRISNSVTADYEASEDIYAGYAMTRFEFPRTNLIIGARFEHTRFSGSAPIFDEDSETFTIGQVDRDYTDIFPNLTIRHEFTDSLIGRFALTRATQRPNLLDVVPRVVQNDDVGGNIINVERGNPDLRQTVSNNVDAGIEYYFPPLGIIGFNVFYKNLENYEFTLTQFDTFGGSQARITQKVNALSGYIAGFEANVQAQFTFLPGFLSGFGVFANASYADAQITLPEALENRPSRVRLPNQSDWTYNAALFYERDGFNARLAYTKRTDYVDEFNSDPRLDTFWVGRGQLDLTASYDFTKNINVFAEAKNLTNSAGVRYAGTPQRVTEFEKFGAFYFIGARVNF